MSQTASLGLRSISPVRMAMALVVVLAGLAGIAALAVDVSRQIDAQSSAASDNLQWALSQVDVELMSLGIAADTAIHIGQDGLTPLRTKFDIFYSRVKILEAGAVFAPLRNDPEYAASFNRLLSFVTETALLVDGPDEDLARALPQLADRITKLIPDGHRIGVVGVGVFAAQSDLRREAVKGTLIQMAILTLTLIAALVIILWRVLSLDRGNRQRAAENAETLDRLDAIIATSISAVITLDAEGRILDFNPAATQTFGLARLGALGQPLELLIPTLGPEGRPQMPPLSNNRLLRPQRFQVMAQRHNGSLFPAEVSLSMTRAGGAPLHVIFLRDMSRQVEAEQALVTARDKALAGEQAKSDLLVVMSHEIRTPLNGMIGTIELLEGTDLDANQREYLRIMAASGRLLMRHINDVLEIARLDSGKKVPVSAPFDLDRLIEEVLENQGPAAIVGENLLRFVPDPGGRHHVQTDETLLRQVLMNLVGNAVKFTRNGEITVSVRHDVPDGMTEITVRDTGIGIAPQNIGRIFEDFVTLDASYARNASGTGLGLGIVRRIVTRLGGSISVDSVVGRGSTFRVLLPLTVLDADMAAPPADAPRLPAAPMAVLVVEDNDFNRLIVRDMLAQEGHQVTEARDGLEGVQLAGSRPFDAILMDISMPGMDGLHATEQIRQGTGPNRATPIMALTAHAMPAETAHFLASGFDEVLLKPLSRDRLRGVLAGLGSQATPTPASVPADTAPMRPADPAPVPAPGPELIASDVIAQLRTSLGPARSERLLEQFLSDTAARMATVQMLAETDGSPVRFVEEIHRMTGSAAMFGATRLHECLSRTEALCKENRKAEARQTVPELMQTWRATEDAYRVLCPQRGDGSLAQASSLR